MEPKNGNFVTRFMWAFFLPWDAMKMLTRSFSLAAYAVIPVVINVIVFGLGIYFLFDYRVDLVELIWKYPADAASYAWFWTSLWYVLAVVIFVLIFLVVFFLFTPIGCLIAAPFNDALSEATEVRLDPEKEEMPFSFGRMVKETALTIKAELQKLLFWLAVFIPAIILNLIPGIGSALYFALTGTVGVFLMAYQFVDYPLVRNQLDFKQKRAFLNKDLAASMGFGAGCTLILLIPFLNLFLIPICVVAGTMLYADYKAKWGLKQISETRVTNP